MAQPEEQARAQIDELLTAAGWVVTDQSGANVGAARGLVVRNSPRNRGHSFADYLFYVGGRSAGVIETKKTRHTLGGVETQSNRYTKGLPGALSALRLPRSLAARLRVVERQDTL